MNEYEEKMKKYMRENDVKGEHMHFDQSCHSVEDAARTVHTSEENFVKNICMVDSQGNFIVAIVKGEDRASMKRVAQALSCERPRTATPEEILQRTGYPCGGTPSFGYYATFLLDPRVMEKEVVYSGGGSVQSLVKIETKALQEANHAIVIRVRK